MKASATHINQAALRTIAQLITTRVAMINQARGLMKLFGLRFAFSLFEVRAPTPTSAMPAHAGDRLTGNAVADANILVAPNLRLRSALDHALALIDGRAQNTLRIRQISPVSGPESIFIAPQ